MSVETVVTSLGKIWAFLACKNGLLFACGRNTEMPDVLYIDLVLKSKALL